MRGQRDRKGSEGQAAVELALALPLVALLLLALVQLGFLVRDQVLVVHAAREGVRSSATDNGVVAAVADDNVVALTAGQQPDQD